MSAKLTPELLEAMIAKIARATRDDEERLAAAKAKMALEKAEEEDRAKEDYEKKSRGTDAKKARKDNEPGWSQVQHGMVIDPVMVPAPSTPPTPSELDRMAAFAKAAEIAMAAEIAAKAAEVLTPVAEIATPATAVTAAATAATTTAVEKCKYYTVVKGNFIDTNGHHQSSKWAKRMRQKASSEADALKAACGGNEVKGKAKGKAEGPARRLPAGSDAGSDAGTGSGSSGSSGGKAAMRG